MNDSQSLTGVHNVKLKSLISMDDTGVGTGLVMHINKGREDEARLVFHPDGLPGFLEYLVGYARDRFPGAMEDVPPL